MSKKNSLSISKIFQEEGETVFRNIETAVLKEIGKRHSLVVATGGGVVTRSENWRVLHTGVVIWIDPDRDLLLTRLQADNVHRPLLEKEDSIGVFEGLLKERLPFYKEADLRVKVFNQSPEQVASLILGNLSSLLKANSDLSG